MLEFKKVSKVELQTIIRNASAQLGVNEVIVEKDYLLCFKLFIYHERMAECFHI